MVPIGGKRQKRTQLRLNTDQEWATTAAGTSAKRSQRAAISLSTYVGVLFSLPAGAKLQRIEGDQLQAWCTLSELRSAKESVNMLARYKWTRPNRADWRVHLAKLRTPPPPTLYTFGARLEEGVVRYRVGAVRSLEVGPQPLRRLDRHLDAVLQHRHWEDVRRVSRAPQPERRVGDVWMETLGLFSLSEGRRRWEARKPRGV